MRSALVPILFAPPGWVLRGGGQVAAVDADFANNRAWVKGKGPAQFPSLLTTTRASTGYAANSSGLLVPFLSNIPRITDLGLLVEQAATNVVLWNRDLTNAAWTPSNITPLKNQTGADGTANAASSITATAGNGTILQAITLGSSARFQHARVKRLTGVGEIDMTMDNGATWTAITVTAAYTQLSIPTQTLANPTVGFRIVTSGDAIAVDFVQNETGTFATSPILDTTVAVTRAADIVQATGAAASAALAAKAAFTQTFGVNGTGTPRIVSFDGLAAFGFNTNAFLRIKNSSVTLDSNTLGAGASQGTVKTAFGFDATSFTARGNGNALATQATAWDGNTGNVWIGSNGSTVLLNGYLQRLAFGNIKGQFNGLTA